jgi:xanthine dehydrogenase accessory factor
MLNIAMINRRPKDIYRAIVEQCQRNAGFALATVLQATGSTPCKVGAKAIIDATGAILGTVGGGAVEAQTQRSAVEAIGLGRPLVFDFHLEGEAASKQNPICGGVMRVLIDPCAAGHLSAYRAASQARQQRKRGVLLTTIRGQNRPEVAVRFLAEGAVPPEIAFPDAESVGSVLRREETAIFIAESSHEEQRLEALAEPLVPDPLLVIAGGGHIGQALAAQACLLGFDILVIDDRREFTSPELFPEDVNTRCGRIAEELDRLAVGGDTYIVIVTRGHLGDAEALAACLHKPAAYIGMIGSRRKVALMRKEFIESGRAAAAEFDRVYAPIGLDIGAATVPEIAASIVAQLIAVRRKKISPLLLGEG